MVNFLPQNILCNATEPTRWRHRISAPAAEVNLAAAISFDRSIDTGSRAEESRRDLGWGVTSRTQQQDVERE